MLKVKIMMNRWDISETGASGGKSDSTHLSYEGAANSDSNIPPSSYQTGTQESIVFLSPSFSPDEKWVKEYMEQFGQEPSFF